MKPQKSASTQRNRELAQIHIAKKALGLDDETYRAVLWDVALVRSASELDDSGRHAVLARFKARGWKNKSQRGAPRTLMNAEKAPLMSKIGALLADMQLPWNYANGIAQQMFNIARLDWCNDEQLRSIIVALIKRQRKQL